MKQDWDVFMTTGNVEAYLSYREGIRNACGENVEPDRDTSGRICNSKQEYSRTGDNLYAGFPNRNRNGNESSTYRGI